MKFTSLEICAGAGGQALGLEKAGFEHKALVEIESPACATLKANRPHWNVIQADVRQFDGSPYRDIDLLAGGVPCPPFSKAGKQLGANDERDLFPEAIRLTKETHPKAIMLENVRGLLDPKFEEYRNHITQQFAQLGYIGQWKLLYAADFGVSQLRPRVIFVALLPEYANYFTWPETNLVAPITVGELLLDLMQERGWKNANEWHLKANQVAPTLVGGSKKHGGADLGPTRSKRAWKELCVDGSGLWDEAPPEDFIGMPRLTARMTARIQGFPDEWIFVGKKHLLIGKSVMLSPLLSQKLLVAKLLKH
ncbi:DNA cytosine methyltransferase [Neisseria leonii]|uniref:Cytosine-specific methyltransferase n=1 Tax=Neisseria leonii TaxID=2995413 RepID=A0A9X4E8Y6_9NEIS|nr:DNA cytosine methyltransferase [Neisseria sp. 51.81]MDD9327728.1 DNA cytosine methyltransferase [Neisseria sp. 51.81]